MERLGYIVYEVGAFVTFVKLAFFDGAVWNWWSWILILARASIEAGIWPLYWLVIRPLFH